MYVVGGVVQIAEHHFRDGINDVRLVVMKADGTTEEINFTINIEMQEPSGSTTQPITGMYLSRMMARDCRSMSGYFCLYMEAFSGYNGHFTAKNTYYGNRQDS